MSSEETSMGTVRFSRVIIACIALSVAAMGATACSGELDATNSPYLDCPAQWQPNSSGEGCAPICSEGTILNANESGCIPDAASADALGAPQGAGGDASGGSAGPDESDDPYIDCPTGWQPNSTGDACAPVCAAGTELNADEDGCVPVPDEEGTSTDATTGPSNPADTSTTPGEDSASAGPNGCPAGYQSADVDGVSVCVPVTNISVHGYVLDSASGQAIAGATVTANALSDTPLVTDESGYFEISGVTQVGNIAVYYSAEGYHSSYAWVGIESSASYGASEVYIDATASLVAVEQAAIEQPVDSDGWVSGTVYAGDQPAAGALVRLRYADTGIEAGNATTDAEGMFMIADVAASGQVFELLVDNYDADGDGTYDYQGETLAIGAINEGGNSSVNASNVVVVLEAIGKSLAYANFTPPLSNVSGPGLYPNLFFASQGANLIFHFGAETQPETLIVSLVARIGGVISQYVDVAASWNAQGTVLTLNPAGLLIKDADPATDYELRIEALLWADGSAFVPQDAGVAGAARFQFQVGEAPTYLPNPIPTIYTDNLGSDDQDVVLVSCDSRECWLLDSVGFPIGGYSYPGEQVDSPAFINGEDGLQLTWPPVDGAQDYKVYARQTYDGPEAANLKGWIQLQLDSLVTGFYASGTPTTVYATGVLATGEPSWLDFGAIGPPDVGNTLAFGNQIQLAITVVDGLGVESPIDEDKTLTLIDLSPITIRSVTETSPDEDFETSGIYDVAVTFGLHFSELVDPESIPSYTVISERFASMTQPSESTWGVPGDQDPMSGSNVSDKGTSHELQFDMKWPCAMLTEDASAGDNTVHVNDLALFPSGAGTEVLFLQGTQSANLAHTNTRTVFENNPVTGEIEFFNPLDNGLNKGDFVCKVLEASGLSAGGGSMFADDPQPGSDVSAVELFHVGQSVLVISTQEVEGGAKSALVYESVVTGMQVPISNGGVILQTGRLFLSGPPPTNFSNSVVFPKPTHTPNFRLVTEMQLTDDISVTPNDAPLTTLDVTQSSFENSRAMVGDLVIIDEDGDLLTIDDQHRVTIERLSTLKDDPSTGDVDESDYDVTFAPFGNNLSAFPASVAFDKDTTRILCMGDSFTMSGLSDTSGNTGIGDKRDQFSFCNGTLPECNNAGNLFY